MSDRRRVTLDFFCELTKRLEEKSADYWLEFGTLLGFARQGSMLAHDDDIDLGIWYEDRWKLVEIINEISGVRFSWEHCIWSGNFCMWIIEPEGGIRLDIYYYKKTKDGSLACPTVYTESKNDFWKTKHLPFSDKAYYFDNLINAEFEGKRVKVPKYYKKHLFYLYGENCIEEVKIKGEDYNDPELESSNGPAKVCILSDREILSKYALEDRIISIDFMNEEGIDYISVGDAKDEELAKRYLQPLSESRVIKE